MFDIILKNNATSKFTIVTGQENVSITALYLQFDVDLDLPDGEYTYCVVGNDRDDVVYDLKEDILSSTITTEESTIEMRDLNPYIGLMRIGDPVLNAVSDDNKKEYYYEG